MCPIYVPLLSRMPKAARCQRIFLPSRSGYARAIVMGREGRFADFQRNIYLGRRWRRKRGSRQDSTVAGGRRGIDGRTILGLLQERSADGYQIRLLLAGSFVCLDQQYGKHVQSQLGIYKQNLMMVLWADIRGLQACRPRNHPAIKVRSHIDHGAGHALCSRD